MCTNNSIFDTCQTYCVWNLHPHPNSWKKRFLLKVQRISRRRLRDKIWHWPFSQVVPNGRLVQPLPLVEEFGHLLLVVWQKLILYQVLNALQSKHIISLFFLHQYTHIILNFYVYHHFWLDLVLRQPTAMLIIIMIIHNIYTKDDFCQNKTLVKQRPSAATMGQNLASPTTPPPPPPLITPRGVIWYLM